MGKYSTEQIVESLEAALDAIVVVIIGLGHIPTEPPPAALDAALRDDKDHQQARRRFGAALEILISLIPPGPAKKAAFKMEENVNALAYQAATVGWRLGRMTSRRRC